MRSPKNSVYIRTLRRWWPLLLGMAVAGGAAGYAIAKGSQSRYAATAQLFVSVRSGSSAADLQQSSSFAQARVRSYASVVTSRAVLEPVSREFSYPGGVNALKANVTAEVPVDTVIISVRVTDKDPRRAAVLANAIEHQFRETAAKLEIPQPDGASSVRVSTIGSAQPPQEPFAPSVRLHVLAGILIATLLTWFILLAREVLDTRLHGTDDAAAVTGLSVLGELPAVRRPDPSQLFPSNGHPTDAHAEAHRQIRTNLRFANVDDPPKLIAVTSSLPGEGKSTVAANIAAALSEVGARVVLVDADLRRPSCAGRFGLPAGPGLTAALAGDTPLAEAAHQWENSTLWVLGAGGTPPNPTELLGSQSMSDLLSELRDSFDYVIVDTPPVLPVADTTVLAPQVDGVLFVARRRLVRSSQVTRAIASLAGVDATMLGVIVNGVPRSDTYGYYSYGPPLKRDSRIPVA